MEIGKYKTTGVVLGKGAFGTVELASDGKNEIAIKCISKSHIVKENMGIQVSKEVSILKRLKHPNIVNIEEVLMSADHLYILMEYITGGELFSKIASGGHITESNCQKYVYQICDALEYCHNLNVCHRDIKPQNILLDNKDNIKLVDFGFATIMEIDDDDDGNEDNDEFSRSMEAPSKKMRETHTLCGTDAYMAPEIVSRRTYTGDKVDVWAMGTVTFFILVGNLPFKKFDMKRNHYDISGLSLNASNFISKCLEVVPEKRSSARELLSHIWIKDKKRNSTDSSDIVDEDSSSSSSEDEDDISIDFVISSSLQKEDVISNIKDHMVKNDWKVKISSDTIKVCKKSDMINISIDTSNGRYNVHVRNGSALRSASFESKNKVKDYILQM